MAGAEKYFAWQHRLVAKELGRRVLEIGCGLGNFTRTLLDREAVVAVDVEAECIDRLKKRYPNRANLHAFTCDINHPGFAALKRFNLDSCVCLNVLEHIEDDRRALTEMSEAIVAGGRIVLIVPAFQALYGPIDKNLGHYRRYSRASLAQLAEVAGLRVRQARYMNTVGFFGWWVNAHILRRTAQSEVQIRLFDRFIVPPMAWLESMVKPFFGQSLFIVLEKP